MDEHVWHHVSTNPPEQGGRGPIELTGMVDLTRDTTGRVRARLLDLVPGRSGQAYHDWLHARNESFRAGVEIAARGFRNRDNYRLACSSSQANSTNAPIPSKKSLLRQRFKAGIR